MTTTETVVFDDVHTIAKYLFSLKDNLSPLKLQKSLYFLFAYHGALYSKDTEEGVFEGSMETPKYLFNADFDAWKYGPVIREVYFANRDGEYNNTDEIQEAVSEIEKHPEIKKFIDELFGQIDSVSDFSLVDRSHEDNAWKEAYKHQALMNKDNIIAEYIEKYV